MRNLIKLFSGLLITIIIFSCSPSTELTDIYSDEAFTGKEIKKILVLGMTTDEWKKKVYENEFRSQLTDIIMLKFLLRGRSFRKVNS